MRLHVAFTFRRNSLLHATTREERSVTPSGAGYQALCGVWCRAGTGFFSTWTPDVPRACPKCAKVAQSEKQP